MARAAVIQHGPIATSQLSGMIRYRGRLLMSEVQFLTASKLADPPVLSCDRTIVFHASGLVARLTLTGIGYTSSQQLAGRGGGQRASAA
jgi:hypothetical protein